LEHVVELGSGEVDSDGLIAGDSAGVLEEADTVLVEGDAGYWKLGRNRGCLGSHGCHSGGWFCGGLLCGCD